MGYRIFWPRNGGIRKAFGEKRTLACRILSRSATRFGERKMCSRPQDAAWFLVAKHKIGSTGCAVSRECPFRRSAYAGAAPVVPEPSSILHGNRKLSLLFCRASGCAILEDQDQLSRLQLPKPVSSSRCVHNEPHRSSGIGKAGAIHPVVGAYAGASAATARY